MILWAFEDIMASPSLGGAGRENGEEKREGEIACFLLVLRMQFPRAYRGPSLHTEDWLWDP